MIQFADYIVYEDSFLAPSDAQVRLATLLREGFRRDHIGVSEEGHEIYGYVFGTGAIRVSLMAGAHADEPVGPETLRRLLVSVAEAGGAERYTKLLSTYTFYVIPHVNPDGEQRNWPWIEKWPDLRAYASMVLRELPGRDVEFSYPERRQENIAISRWLAEAGPFHLHMSLHGMGFSDGAMLLIEKNWSYRTDRLQSGFSEVAKMLGLGLHDHNRKGEKGFFQIAPGFTTTPEGKAMRTYFESHGDPATAMLFGDSSMEYVRSLGGDPLCLVTEMPLFLVRGTASVGSPDAYLEFKSEHLPLLRLPSTESNEVEKIIEQYGLEPLPISEAGRLQLTALDIGLESVGPAVSV